MVGDLADLFQVFGQPGDEPPEPFSMLTDRITTPQIQCGITRTTPATHDVIRANVHRSPMYSGQIKSSGPRYCPSIEDKIVRFGDRDGHQIFLEPEGLDDATSFAVAQKFTTMFAEGFMQDVHIWLNKAPVQNPLLCEEDGPVYQLRRWYEQFYVDKADVVPEMTDRFEFEVDTTKANEYWQEEVAENLRRKAEEEAGAPDSAMTSS